MKKKKFVLNTEAYHNGKKAPCQDAELLKMLSPVLGANNDLYDSWIEGWHTENAKAE